MKFVRGKRQFKQEQLWGFVLMTEAGVRTFGLVLGRSVWGFQWKIMSPTPKRGSARTSRKSNPNTGNKSSQL